MRSAGVMIYYVQMKTRVRPLRLFRFAVRPPRGSRQITLSLNTLSLVPDPLGVENDSVAKSDGLGNKSNPGNRMPGIPSPKPPIDPYVPIPEGPAVRSDGSIADAWASALATTYRSEAFAILSGISMCSSKDPCAAASLPPENGAAIRSCNCKCCVVSYLAYKLGDNDLFYLESAAVLDMSCDNAKSAPGLWAVYPNFVRRFFYKDWR